MATILRVAMVIAGAILFASCDKGYEVGSVTKGNPDNSYLDSCEIYCCGD